MTGATSRFHVVAPGGMDWQAAPADAVIVMDSLRRSGVDAVLALPGAGSDFEHARFTAYDLGLEGSIVFAPEATVKAVRRTIETADAVLDMRVKGCAREALETAVLLRVPVVATALPSGFPEDLAVRVPPRDIDAAALALLRIARGRTTLELA